MAFLCEQEKYRGTKSSVFFKDQDNGRVYIDFNTQSLYECLKTIYKRIEK